MALPLLRVGHARDAFFKKLMGTSLRRENGKQDDLDLEKAFTAAILELEKGAWRWGNACPECHRKMEFEKGYFWCADHGLTRYSVLLVAFPPIGSESA